MPSWQPHPALRPYVRSIAGYHDRPAPDAVHHGLPSSTLTVIIAFDDPLDCGWLARPAQHDRFWTSAAGLHTEPALIRTHGHQHGFQLALTPGGARVLLGLPAAALAGDVVDHLDLPRGISTAVHARLAELPTWDRRFELLEQTLLQAVADSDEVGEPAELTEAWRLLECSAGQLRVAEVAQRVGWSRRALLTRFRAEYGITPKDAARLVRFERSRARLRDGLPIAEIAHRYGYADQSHLTRDWTELSGRTPLQLAGPAYHPADASHLSKTWARRSASLAS